MQSHDISRLYDLWPYGIQRFMAYKGLVDAKIEMAGIGLNNSVDCRLVA